MTAIEALGPFNSSDILAIRGTSPRNQLPELPAGDTIGASAAVLGSCIRWTNDSPIAIRVEGDRPSAAATARSALEDGRPRPLSMSAMYG